MTFEPMIDATRVTLFQNIGPVSAKRSSSCKPSPIRSRLWPVVVEHFRRRAKRRDAQAAIQSLALESQAGFDFFADHSVSLFFGRRATRCDLHGTKPDNGGGFDS